MFDRKVLALVLVAAFSVAAFAETVAVRPDHPDRYTVVKGDTLWDISGMFLEDPWNWPRIWHINPQVQNPHLIYPGDVLSLIYVNGEPRLTVTPGDRTVKLSPQIREVPQDQAVTTIPLESISQFVSRNRLILTEQDFEQAPYVVDSLDRHLAAGPGHAIYVRAIEDASRGNYSLYRKGQPYVDPKTEEILGYEAIYLGDARLDAPGDPARMTLLKTNREVLLGDRVFAYRDDRFDPFFQPHPPREEIDGQIIAVVDGLSEVGQFQTVVVNLGDRHNMEVGHVVSIQQQGLTVRDTISDRDDEVTLPDERAGTAIIYRTFENVSYALVVDAIRAIHVNDVIRNP